MVETKGYTLEEIVIAFDGSTANLLPAGVPANYETAEQGSDHASDHKARETEDVK